MNIPQTPHSFDFHQQISEVVLVGLGGTGSQVARTLCRVVYDLRRRGHHTPSIKFVDPDIVEMKNVARQMYLEHDVNTLKSVTLSRRFNLAMGLNIVAYPELFNAEKHCGRYGTLVVGCVDNYFARIALSQVHGIWLECGNELTAGSICLGNTSHKEEVQRCIKSGQYTQLPNAALLFPQLLEPDPTPELKIIPAASCAELTQNGEQALLVNDMVGIVAGEYVYKLLNRLPIYSFLTYVDTESLSMRSISITPENLKPYLESAE